MRQLIAYESFAQVDASSVGGELEAAAPAVKWSWREPENDEAVALPAILHVLLL